MYKVKNNPDLIIYMKDGWVECFKSINPVLRLATYKIMQSDNKLLSGADSEVELRKLSRNLNRAFE